MAKRFFSILVLHLLALAFITLAYSRAESRPFGRQAETPPYLQALPLARELPPAIKENAPEIGMGTKKFHRPGVEGYRLDWCASGAHQGCGPPAAQMFCQWQGYSRAVSMVEEQGVGLVEPTRRIASNRQCLGPDCSGFLSITCTKS